MPARPPSLRAIVAFEAAARHGTFRDAARELNLTDSAVGHAIRGLEERLGSPLFVRVKGGVRLTARGRALLARVSAGLSILGEAFEIQASRTKGQLAMTVLPAFAERFLCPRLPRFIEAGGDMQLEIASTAELVDLGDAEVDLGIRYGTGRWGGVRTRMLAPATLVAVASPSYRDGKLPASARQLAACNLIEERHTPWRLVWAKLGAADAPPVSLRVDCISVALSAAEAGVGVALTPHLLAADALAAGRLQRVTNVEVRSELGFWVAWRNSSDRQPAIESFASWLAAEAERVQPF